MDEHQEQVAAEFLASHTPNAKVQRTYEAAWEIELEREALKAGCGSLSVREWRQRVGVLRRQSRKLVSAPGRAAAPARMEIHRAALRYLQHCGGVGNFNISAFVRYVRSKPTAKRIYRSGEGRMLTDHAIRAILKQRLGIVGKPGRKRKKL